MGGFCNAAQLESDSPTLTVKPPTFSLFLHCSQNDIELLKDPLPLDDSLAQLQPGQGTQTWGHPSTATMTAWGSDQGPPYACSSKTQGTAGGGALLGQNSGGNAKEKFAEGQELSEGGGGTFLNGH